MKHTDYHESRLRKRRLSFIEDGIPSRFVFVLTNKCNLSCDFCFQDRRSLPKAMTEKDWMDTIEKLPEGSHVTLTGGEPILFKGFKSIFREVTRYNTVNIICNGVMLNDEVMELFLSTENFLVLSISIDTVGNTNRKVKEKDYENMARHLASFSDKKKLTSHPAIIDTKTVVTNENSRQLFSIFKHCVEDLKSESHSFQFLKGNPLQHSDKVTDDFSKLDSKHPIPFYTDIESIVKQFESVNQYCWENNVRCFTHPGHINFGPSPNNFKSKLQKYYNNRTFRIEDYDACTAPWESVHINADGKVFPCLAYDFGDIRNFSDMRELFNSENALRFRDTLRKRGLFNACAGCGYLSAKSK